MPGIASAGTIVMNDNRGAVETEAEPVTDDQFEFNEYKYEDGIGDTIYFLVVKNNSDSTVSFESNGTAKDSNGNVLGSAECSIDVLGPDEQSIAYFYFDGVTGIDSVDYTKTFDTDSYYKPVISNLDVEGNLNEQNATLTVTNKGSYAAQFVRAYALFFDADNIVYCERVEERDPWGLEWTQSGQLITACYMEPLSFMGTARNSFGDFHGQRPANGLLTAKIS